ncbi:hypothetical protein SH449x_003567 [Pirellulaceae bacterium SH449]
MRKSIGSAIGYGVWAFGTFLFTLIVLFDYLIGAKLPGGVIYVVFVLGPILAVCGAVATNHRIPGKIYLILATLCFLPIQFIIIGIVLLATTGLEGIQ